MATAKFQLYLNNGLSMLKYNVLPAYTLSHSDKTSEYLISEGYIWLGEREVEIVELPADALIEKTVEGMCAKLAAHRAEAETKATEMERQINDMLMIGHTTTPNSGGDDIIDDGIPF